jgi:Zn ribbon nucleic-acid-binding protein
MAFIQHTNCPKCGSKDNLAEYSDGFYCFGCGYKKQKNDLNSVRNRLQSEQTMLSDELDIPTTNDIPIEPMQWLLQYGITQQDVDTYKLGWNANNQMLVLVNTPQYYQARNFSKHGPKYISKGKKPLLFYGLGDILICVEDVISAIKIAKANKNVTVTPLLGSIISLELTETILKRFKKIYLWLDRDKAIEAVKQARNIKQKGIDSDVIITPNDPKDYSTGEINQWLRNK